MVMLVAAGCGKTEGGGAAATEKGVTHVYHMRGEIKALGTTPEGDITIHHEAVPEFRNTLDQVEPMGSMTMPFEVKKGVSLEGLKVGDKIAFDWEVNWDAEVHEVTAISKLPAGTVLTFGAAATATASAPATR
jgi:Cu/Ag efflux protein CusF